MHFEDHASGKSERLLRNELIISYVLRYGVLLCGALLACGVLGRLLGLGVAAGSSASLIQQMLNGAMVADYQPVVAPGELARGILSFSPDLLMAAGMVLLISLPIVRVGMTVVLFLLERDWIFFGITLTVFTVLLFSLILGRAL